MGLSAISARTPVSTSMVMMTMKIGIQLPVRSCIQAAAGTVRGDATSDGVGVDRPVEWR